MKTRNISQKIMVIQYWALMEYWVERWGPELMLDSRHPGTIFSWNLAKKMQGPINLPIFYRICFYGKFTTGRTNFWISWKERGTVSN